MTNHSHQHVVRSQTLHPVETGGAGRGEYGVTSLYVCAGNNNNSQNPEDGAGLRNLAV